MYANYLLYFIFSVPNTKYTYRSLGIKEGGEKKRIDIEEIHGQITI